MYLNELVQPIDGAVAIRVKVVRRAVGVNEQFVDGDAATKDVVVGAASTWSVVGNSASEISATVTMSILQIEDSLPNLIPPFA